MEIEKININIDCNCLPTDSEMIDFLQQIITNDDDLYEIKISALRGCTGRVEAFQLETKNKKILPLNKSTLRQLICEAIRLNKIAFDYHI